MAIDWGSAGLNIDMNAPKSPLQAAVEGYGAGQKINAQGLANEQQATLNKEMPALLQLQKATLEGKISIDQIDAAKKSYELGQAMMQPIMMAVQNKDLSSAKDMFDQTRQRLEQSGLDPAKLGVPEQFDANWLKNAYATNSTQLDILGKLTAVQKNQAQTAQANANAAKDIYEMGGTPDTSGLPGSFSYPGQAQASGTTGAAAAALGPKAQQQLALEKQKSLQEFVSKQQDTVAASNDALMNIKQLRALVDEGPNLGIASSGASLLGNSNLQRQESIINQFRLDKIRTDYAGMALGALDVPVFNALSATVPNINATKATKQAIMDRMEAGIRGGQVKAELYTKALQAGFNKAQMIELGNEVAKRLNINEKSQLKLSNFDNASEIIDNVIKEKQGGAPTTNAAAPEADFAKLGWSQAQIDRYKQLEAASKKAGL